MAYDKQKAHEYYENYTKKGKLKGRGKGSKKKTSKKKGKTTNLIGLSTSGLNDEGKMEFALMKEKLTGEMNAALKNAKNDGEKDAIRREYQKKALSEVQKLKSSPQYQSAKKSSKGSSKSSGSSKGSGSSKSSGSSKISGGSSNKSSSGSKSKSSGSSGKVSGSSSNKSSSNKSSNKSSTPKNSLKNVSTKQISALGYGPISSDMLAWLVSTGRVIYNEKKGTVIAQDITEGTLVFEERNITLRINDGSGISHEKNL